MEKNNIVKDLIIMFVTENYKKYLKENNIKFIEEKNIEKIIKELYIEKKDNLKVWLKECLKEMQKDGAGFAGFSTYLDMSPSDPDMAAIPDPKSLNQLC